MVCRQSPPGCLPLCSSNRISVSPPSSPCAPFCLSLLFDVSSTYPCLAFSSPIIVVHREKKRRKTVCQHELQAQASADAVVAAIDNNAAAVATKSSRRHLPRGCKRSYSTRQGSRLFRRSIDTCYGTGIIVPYVSEGPCSTAVEDLYASSSNRRSQKTLAKLSGARHRIPWGRRWPGPPPPPRHFKIAG